MRLGWGCAVADHDLEAERERLKRRERRGVISLWFVALPLGGSVALAAFWALGFLVIWLDPAYADPDKTVLETLLLWLNATRLGGWFLIDLDEPGPFGISEWILAHPALSAILVGTALAAIFAIGWAGKAYRRFFAPFATNLFSPLPPLKAIDPLRPLGKLAENDQAAHADPLPWRVTPASPMGEAWTALKTFAENPDGLQRHKLDYQVLIGRPGSGKSRLSVEFLRAMGGLTAMPAPSTAPSTYAFNETVWEELWRKMSSLFAAWRQDLASWWHVQVLCRPCREGEPWDVGWIDPHAHAKAAMEARASLEEIAPLLREWQPRRPTLLLLDDPYRGDALQTLRALNEHARQFRHPVRLLIVDQSIPGDLEADWQDGGWAFQRFSTSAQPIELRQAHAFTAEDIRVLRYTVMGDACPSDLRSDAGVKHFLIKTRGNPLVSELAFTWLREPEHTLHDMTRPALLRKRAQRIVEALRAAGISEAGLAPIAAATIAHVHLPRAVFEAQEREATGARVIARSALAVFERFQVPVESAALARAFALEVGRLHRALPPVRPEMIGMAFVSEVFAKLGTESAERILKAAWELDPYGTLRTVLQVERDPTADDDPLAEALTRKPPEGLAISDIALFGAYAEAGCTLAQRDLDDDAFFVGKGLETTALEIAKRLDPQGVRAALEFAITLFERRPGDRYPRQDALCDLALNLLELALQKQAFATAEELLATLLTLRRLDVGTVALHPTPLAQDVVFPAPADDDTVLGLARESVLAFRQWGRMTSTLYHLMQRLLSAGALGATGDTLVQVLTLMQTARQTSGAAAQDLAEDLDSAGLDEYLKCQVWRSVAAGHAMTRDPSAAERAAEKVAAIAAGSPESEDLQYAAAYAWSPVAAPHAVSLAPSAPEGAAAKVAAIAARWPESEGIQLYAAEAWRFVSGVHAITGNPAAKERTEEKVTAIVDAWPDAEDIQIQAALAWAVAAETHTDDENKAFARRFAGLADTIIAKWPDGFESNLLLQRLDRWLDTPASGNA